MEKCDKMVNVDFHVHSLTSFDGVEPINKILSVANGGNVRWVSVTDHNTFDGVVNYIKGKNFTCSEPYLELDGVNLIPGAEVSCSLRGLKNNKGKTFKTHLGVYCPDLSGKSPIVTLTDIKRESDIELKFGRFVNIARAYGYEPNPVEIKNFIIGEISNGRNFNNFTSDMILHYLKKKKVDLPKSKSVWKKTLKDFVSANGVGLDYHDVIDLCHASGGFCVMMHPGSTFGAWKNDEDIPVVIESLLDAGIDGFEIQSPGTTKEYIEKIKEGIDRFNLKNEILFTAGSDTHRIDRNFNSIGKCGISNIQVSKDSTILRELENLSDARRHGELTNRVYPSIDNKKIDATLDYYRKAVEADGVLSEPFLMELF